MSSSYSTEAVSLLGNTVKASEIDGETVFTHAFSAGSEMPTDSLTPIKHLLSGFIRLLKGFKSSFKNKKQWVTIIIMTILWIVLTVLPILGISASFLSFLSFLTFAQGGVSSKVSSIIGGTIGKGIFTYFIFALILPLFSGKKPFTGVGGGLKKVFGSLAARNLKALTILLFGVGISLITYNFLTGKASLENSMVGIAAFFLSARALANKAGFLRGFVISFINKYFKGLSKDIANVNRLIAAYSIGFAFAVLLSATGIGFICYLIGILLLITSIILKIVSGRRKGAGVQ